MFSVTAKGLYGLSALVDLCDSYQSGPRQIKDIAQLHNIPQHYLEQILVTLKKGSLVESIRGSLGGYMLAKHPSQITILEALTLLEGKIELLSDDKKNNNIGFFWTSLEKLIKDQLSRSLESLSIEYKTNQNQLYFEI